MEIKLKLNGQDVVLNISDVTVDGKPVDIDNNKEVLDLKWKPKLGEKYFSFDCYMQPACFVWTKTQNDEQYYLANKCFKTLEEAKKYSNKFAEILKNREL